MYRLIYFALAFFPCSLALSQTATSSTADIENAPIAGSQSDNANILLKSTWRGSDGEILPNPMTIVDYLSAPLTLTQRRGVLFVNKKSSKMMTAENLSLVEAIADSSQEELVGELKKQKGKPMTLSLDVVILKQVNDGRLINLPIAMLDPADRVLAQRAGQILLQQQQMLAQRMFARGQLQHTNSQAARRAKLLAYLAAGGTLPGGTSSLGNVDQQGEHEGQFGDQNGPDLPGQSEGSGDVD